MNRNETVILLHGLGRTRVSMKLLQKRLESVGYRTLSFGYMVALDGSIDEISGELRRFVARHLEPGERYHFVGHSLGNIIVRDGFREGYPPGLGRLVMLAPPNRPPLLAKLIQGLKLFRLFSGSAGRSLADDAFYEQLPVPSVEFGVIAGNVGHSLTFEEPNDGIVTVASTRLEGMKEHLVLRHVHTFIMNGRDSFEAIVQFLESGSFAVTSRVKRPTE